MPNKNFNTRIQQKYDTYANWTANNPTPLSGELCIVVVPAEAGAVAQEPSILFKVGDGSTAFNNLPYVSAVAADVYDWAKSEKKPSYSASEISDLNDAISDAVQDTNTTYRIVAGSDNNTYKLQSKEINGSWVDVTDSTITIPADVVTGVKGSAESTYRTGNIEITPENIGLGNVTNESKSTMFTNAALTGVPTAPTAENGTDTTQIATTAFVQAEINSKIAAADAMIFKGTLGASADSPTITSLPTTHNTGWTYKVVTAGTYAGVACEVGDMVVCLTDGTAADDAHWTVIQSNIDGAVTGPANSVADHVAVFDGATGKVIKDSGYTIASDVPADAKFTDTTYGVAVAPTEGVSGSDGLLSKEDKAIIDGLAAVAKSGKVEDLAQDDYIIFNCGSSSTVI